MRTCQESSQLTILKNKSFGLFTSQPGNTAHTNIFSVEGLGCWAERKIFRLNNAAPFPPLVGVHIFQLFPITLTVAHACVPIK